MTIQDIFFYVITLCIFEELPSIQLDNKMEELEGSSGELCRKVLLDDIVMFIF